MRSFRSNVVLKWEWRRGSMLYLVWQTERFGDEDGAPLGGASMVPALFESLAAKDRESRLAVKLTYWLPVD